MDAPAPYDGETLSDPLNAVTFTDMAAFLRNLAFEEADRGVAFAMQRGRRDYDYPTRARVSRHRYNARMLAIAETWLTRLSPREVEVRLLMVEPEKA